MSQPKTDRAIFKQLWNSVDKYRATLIASLLLYLPITLLSIAEPLIIGAAVQYGFVPKDLNSVMLWATLYFATVVLASLFQMSQLFSLSKAGQAIVQKLRTKVFSKIQSLPMKYFDKTPMGALLTRVTNDSEAVVELFTSGSVAIFGDILFLIATIVMLMVVDIKLSLSVWIIIPILIIGMAMFRRWTKTAFQWVRKELAKLNGFLQEHLSGMAVVQGFAQVERIGTHFDECNTEYMLANRRAVFLDAAVYSFVDALSVCTVALVLLWGYHLDLEGALQLGVLVAFIEAMTRFFFPVREIANRLAIIQSAMVAASRMVGLLDEPSEGDVIKCDVSDHTRIREDNRFSTFSKSLDFKNVTLSYDGKSDVLKDVCFTVDKGKRIALVGPTGAGKSSTVKIATRFYDIKSGSIELDKTPIQCIPLKEYRPLFNLVPQEPFLFSGTLRDNLMYGLGEDPGDEKLTEALHNCQIDYILTRDGGLDQKIEPRGQNFSVGERQLIAFSRAMLSPRPILILDEATASIDVLTEKRLQRATVELIRGRTAMIIAHRLSTIKDCDEILVFDKGRIIERGDHQQLMNANGLYAKMVLLQKKERELARG